MQPSDDLVLSLASAAPDALVAVRIDGGIAYVNDQAEQLFGWDRQELEGKPADRLLPEWDGARSLAAGGGHMRARRRDGSEFAAEISLREFEAAGGAFLALAVRDVTTALRTEHRLRAVLASAPDAMLGVDASGRIELLNAQTERLFGWTAEELLGRQIEALVPEAVVDCHVRHRASYPADPRPRPMGAGLQLSARRKDGTTFPAEISLSSVIEEPGSLLVLAAIRDVTDRLELEAERRRQAVDTQVERSHRLESLGQLAGGVAHDFNNLLGVILNFSTLISRRVTDPTVAADVDEIRAAADRGATLVRQLLTFARRDVANPKPIEVNAAVRESASMLQRTLGEQVELRLDLAPGRVVALADPNQLEQIVLNLAINSRDAMPGGGRLTIATERRPPAEGRRKACDVVLRVADTGHGMGPDVVKRAFEPFFTTKMRGQGTGLGLATVYGIVSQNAGEVTIDSTEGEGTTVTVVLPGALEAARDDGRPPASLMGGHERILLVEDEPTLRTGTARLLADQGYEVLMARDGLEALEAFDRELGAIDLVLTDVAMPRMRGDELARELAERATPVGVILMTGYDSGNAPLTARVLAKPVAENDLLRVIREVLDE